MASGELEERTFQKLRDRNLDFCIILDLPVDYHTTWLHNLKAEQIILIDHHPPKEDLNKVGIAHYNPRFENPEIYISASEICYEICKKLGVRGIKWIAKIGAVGDRSIKPTEKEMKAVEYIDAVKVVKGEDALKEVVEALLKCKSVDEFLSIKSYQKMAEKVNKEVEKWVQGFSPHSEICFYEIDTPYSIISRVANEIFDKYPDKTIIVYGLKGSVFKISGRSRKYDLGRIFHEASKGIGKGGGHEVAAGARIEADKIDIFLNRLEKFFKTKKQ
jgi:single-stranded DNA-specific DHH superfamily exonuclease